MPSTAMSLLLGALSISKRLQLQHFMALQCIYASTKSAAKSQVEKVPVRKYIVPMDKWGTLGVNMTSVQDQMGACFIRLNEKLSQLRTGRATTGHLEGIVCSSSGKASIPIVRLATVTNKDAQTLLVHLHDESYTKSVLAALQSAGRDFVITCEPGRIMVTLPKMTREARERMVKTASEAAEDCKRSVRSVRNAAVAESNAVISVIDARRAAEAAVQKMYLSHIAEIEGALERKKCDLLPEQTGIR